jgi:hypothetical protein
MLASVRTSLLRGPVARAAALPALRQCSSKVRHNAFKAAITARGRRQIGLWTGLRSTLVAEMLSHVSGFDWFVIDMEVRVWAIDARLYASAVARGAAGHRWSVDGVIWGLVV